MTKYLQNINNYDLNIDTLCSKQMNHMSFDDINDQGRWDRKNGKKEIEIFECKKIYYVFWKSFFALAVTIGLNYLQNRFGICKYQIPLKICYVVWYVQLMNIITDIFKMIITYRFKKIFHLIHSLPILSIINVYQCDINVSPFRNSNKWKLNKQCIHYNFSHLVVLFRDIYTHIYHFGYGSLLFIIFLLMLLFSFLAICIFIFCCKICSYYLHAIIVFRFVYVFFCYKIYTHYIIPTLFIKCIHIITFDEN